MAPLSTAEILALLAQGELKLEGRLVWSSNAAFLARVHAPEGALCAIYKPARGERPLWDFPAGTLCRREVATFLLGQSLGWPAIPPVVLRQGPLGLGSVQLYVDVDEEAHYFTWRQSPARQDELQRIALFDVVVNNADRKGGHLLLGPEDQVWAIDHGLTFHVEYKLRTVIWDYAGQPIPPEMAEELGRLQAALAQEGAPLVQALSALIAPEELAALRRRLHALLQNGHFPRPRPGWRNVPYPLS